MRFASAANVALSASLIGLPRAIESIGPPLGELRHLTSIPTGYGTVGQTLYGTENSAGTNDTSFVEFGKAVALSVSGLRLAVGALKHDWATPSGTNLFDVVEDGGAVFVYDIDGGIWGLKTFFHGNALEKLGDRLSMSADGSILALRRYNDGPDYVQVYHIDADGNKTKLGQDITCPSGGVGVTLSPDGTRLAASCEYDSSEAGTVKIYDYQPAPANTWTQIGELTNEFSDGLFGWMTAFSSDGNRIAASAPNYDGGLYGRGFVRVYDFVGPNDWQQVGPTLFGTPGSEEKFGTSMDLSSNGTILGVGAPSRPGIAGNATHPAGAVLIYRLSDGVSPGWTLDMVIEGEGANDKFGRSVSISDDGSRFVASSRAHNEWRGQMRLFEWSGTEWAQVAEFEGSAPGDRIGDGVLGVSMAGDATRFAAGSTRAATNGLVEVFTEATPSESPSASPSLSAVPTLLLINVASPTIAPSPEPSSSPSLSAAPSTPEPTFAPVEMGKFDWILHRVGSAEVRFSQETETEEIMLNYNISLRDFKIQVFEEDCITNVPPSVASTSGLVTQTSSRHGLLEVDLDIKQANVVGSGIWIPGDVGVAYVSLCIRVDLLLDDTPNATSVHFHEQKLFITIGLIQGFEVDNVDLIRASAAEEENEAGVEYELLACQCNEDAQCLTSTLSQGSDVYICIRSLADNVMIIDIDSLIFSQGSYSVNSVMNGIADQFTTVTVDGQLAVIRSQMLSIFFEQENPTDVTASGFALLGFIDSSGTRFLRSSITVRALNDHVQDTAFNVKLGVESSMKDTSDASGGVSVMSIIVIMLGAAVLVG